MTDKILELIVEGVDREDPSTRALIAEHLGDLGWGAVNSVVTVGLVGDFDDVVCEASLIARRVAHGLPGARVARWYDDLVTTGEIANRVGVTREAVRLWANAKRGPKTFPQPFAFVGLTDRPAPVWPWGRVSEWLDANGQAGDGVQYPTDMQIAEINAILAGVHLAELSVSYLPPVRAARTAFLWNLIETIVETEGAEAPLHRETQYRWAVAR